MAPSPSKGKGIHKSSGKIFRRKDQDNSRLTNSGSHASNGSGSNNNGNNGSNNGSTKKEDSNGNSSSSNSSTSSSNNGFSASSSLDLKESALTLPVMAAIDHSKHLPRYSNLLEAGRSRAVPAVCSGESLSMEELDNLQLELELLASSILVRQSAVTAQLGVIEHLEKGKPPPRPQLPSWGGKRIKTDPDGVLRPTKKAKDSTGKARDVTHLPPAPSHHALPPPPPSKIPKVKCSIVRNEPLFDVPDLPSSEPPRPPPPRNDITNRFWAMVDTYCQEMTADDIKMLQDLIAAHNDDPDIYKVQPLGKHYTLRWAQEDILDEQKEGSKLSDTNGSKQKKGAFTNDVSDKLLREVDLNHSTTDDTGPLGPLAQRLLAGLVEEKVMQQPENSENKGGVGIGRPGFLRSLGLGSGAGLEKRLRKELQDHGLIEPDLPGQEDDDEILQELRRCQAELRGVAAHNHTQLTRLLTLARDALYRHDLMKKLRDAEAKVIEAYKNISSMRVKKKPPSKKDKDAAWKAIKDREGIVRQLDSLSSS